MKFKGYVLIGALALAGCGQSTQSSAPDTPQLILPNPETFGRRDRNFGLTESVDGSIRAFVAQRGDFTNIMIMRRTDAGWTEPTPLDFPHRETNMSAHFSPFDGRFYFATDAPHPERPGRKDLNIWSGILKDDNTLEDARPMPNEINTGAEEDSIAFTADGDMFFTSSHRRGAGGFDIYAAHKNAEGVWEYEGLPNNTRMADTQVVVTPDGQHMFNYAHMPDVIGVVDIYRRDRTEDGWSDPINLGPLINTETIDYGPGLSADGTRFFFSRDGQLMEVALEVALSAPEAD